MPPKNAVGMNTAISTSVIEMTGPVTSFIALDGGFARRFAALDVVAGVLDDHDGVVHHDADRQDQPEQGEQVHREAQERHERERADDGDRHGRRRHQQRRQLWRKTRMTISTRPPASASVKYTSLNRRRSTNFVVSKGIEYSMPGGSVGLIRSIASRTPLATSSALEPGS